MTERFAIEVNTLHNDEHPWPHAFSRVQYRRGLFEQWDCTAARHALGRPIGTERDR
jgi:hypothetical protein